MKKTVMLFLTVILLAVTSVAVISLVISLKTLSQWVIMEPHTLYISSVKIDDSSLSLSGLFVLDSARVYKKHTCEIIGDTAYIKVYGSYSRRESEFGEFDFTVSGDFSEVREVVLAGENGSMTLLSEIQEENAMIRIYPIHYIKDIDYFVIADDYTVIHMTGDMNTDFYRSDTRGCPVLSSVETFEAYRSKEEIKRIDGFISEIKENSGDNWRVGDGSPIRLCLDGEYFGAHRHNDPVYELYDYLHTLFGIDMKEFNYA